MLRLVSILLFFAISFEGVESELNAREVYNALSDKLNSLVFDMDLIRSDLAAIKKHKGKIDNLLGDKAVKEKVPNIVDLKQDGTCTAETKDSSDHRPTAFIKRILKAFHDEKMFVRQIKSQLEHSITDLESLLVDKIERMSGQLRADIKANEGKVDELVESEVVYKENQQGMHERISNLEDKTITIHRQMVAMLPFWGDWQSWSSCSYNCTNGGRIQTRTRHTLCSEDQPCSETRSETESRPCNAVQFAGCIKDYGDSDNYAVTYDFADQMAQSTCVAMMEAGGHVRAVRRLCSSQAPDCNATCRNIGTTCFNSLHVYRGSDYSPVLSRNDVGKKGLMMYRYNGCVGSGCGPNFCCCKGL